MPKPENLIGQGFDKHPERINKKGRPPVQSLKAILKKLIDSQAPKAIIDLAYVQKLTTKPGNRCPGRRRHLRNQRNIRQVGGEGGAGDKTFRRNGDS